MNKQELIDIINITFKDINPQWVPLIERYKEFLIEYNRKVNLTRLDTEDKIYGSYFYESIIPYKNVDFKSVNDLLDIGSGSGIPGIVLKILYPHIHLEIIESNAKKVLFLNELVAHLGLTNVDVYLRRAEIIEEKNYEKFDLVTSRAVDKLKIMLEISVGYAKVGGLVIVPKSTNYEQEAKGLKQLCSKLDVTYKLENFISKTDTTHNVFVFTKSKKTNRIYPRAWTKIIQANK